MVSTLLKLGADANKETLDGDSALHVAALGGDAVFVQVLIANGANPNHQNIAGNTPLHVAMRAKVWTQAHIVNTVRGLVHAGANVHLKNMHGQCPLVLACSLGLDYVVHFFVNCNF